MDEQFWAALDKLVAASRIIIDRPKGTAHPRYPSMIYPVDYGYLADSTSMDGGGIDIWLGTASDRSICGVICTVDLLKRDSEIKILMGCTDAEIQSIHSLHNNSEKMKGLLICRH